MSLYPACRYAVVDGVLESEVIDGPDQEREGWEPTPHRFRALTVQEFSLQGHPPAEAAQLHERELRRVALIFKGRSLDEAEALADAEPEPEPKPVNPEEMAAARAEIARLTEALTAKDAATAEMVAKFDQSYAEVVAECGKLKTANAQLRMKIARDARGVAKTEPDENPPAA